MKDKYIKLFSSLVEKIKELEKDVEKKNKEVLLLNDHIQNYINESEYRNSITNKFIEDHFANTYVPAIKLEEFLKNILKSEERGIKGMRNLTDQEQQNLLDIIYKYKNSNLCNRVLILSK